MQWTESVGLTPIFRDRTPIKLQTPSGDHLCFDVLDVFPPTSESKWMGIIVRDQSSGEITFLQKGADVAMPRSCRGTIGWKRRREYGQGSLRTLVVGKKRMSKQSYQTFRE